MLTLAGQYPAKGNYETEHSGGTWVGDQVRSDFEEITHVMRSWGRTYVKWNLAANQNDGPNTGGCNTCSPLVTVNANTGAISYDIDFYTLGHFSKFVLPGAYRIYSSDASGIVSAAFLNPDGSKVLVAFNDTPDGPDLSNSMGKQTNRLFPAGICRSHLYLDGNSKRRIHRHGHQSNSGFKLLFRFRPGDRADDGHAGRLRCRLCR